MTYLDSRLTDAEILKACAYAESPHLRVVAQRLRERCSDIETARQHAETAIEELNNRHPLAAFTALQRCIDSLNP